MKGIIIKGIGGFYYVKINDKVVECKARGKFRYDKLSPAVGDKVEIEIENGKGVIINIEERLNKLIRPAVSNVNQAFVVCTLKNPDLNYDLINSFLLLCEFNKIKPIICVNKIDLADACLIEEFQETMRGAYEDIYLVNGRDGFGILELQELLKDKTTVFCGPSGVGKSTILNKIAGRSLMETGDISEKLKRGKHTTRHSELIETSGGFVVDTPGFSSIELDFVSKEELKYYFPEFKDHNDQCRFTGCMHYKEPNCSVKEALAKGVIDKKRYDFYIRTLEKLSGRRQYK